MNEAELQQKADAFGLKGKCYPEVNAALADLLTHAKEDDLILICGSVFLVAEVNIKSTSVRRN
jgi:dihydrofolate synthase/folylpolyglutamate synthase